MERPFGSQGRLSRLCPLPAPCPAWPPRRGESGERESLAVGRALHSRSLSTPVKAVLAQSPSSCRGAGGGDAIPARPSTGAATGPPHSLACPQLLPALGGSCSPAGCACCPLHAPWGTCIPWVPTGVFAPLQPFGTPMPSSHPAQPHGTTAGPAPHGPHVPHHAPHAPHAQAGCRGLILPSEGPGSRRGSPWQGGHWWTLDRLPAERPNGGCREVVESRWRGGPSRQSPLIPSGQRGPSGAKPGHGGHTGARPPPALAALPGGTEGAAGLGGTGGLDQGGGSRPGWGAALA